MPLAERLGRARQRPALVLAVALAVLVAGVLAVALRDRYPTSAERGREGVRAIESVPQELPEDVVPPGAEDVEGTVARDGDDWTSAVTFVVAGGREPANRHVDAALTTAGFAFRQRAFDDVSLQEIYDGPEGSVVSVTYQEIPEGTGVAVVLQGERADG